MHGHSGWAWYFQFQLRENELENKLENKENKEENEENGSETVWETRSALWPGVAFWASER